jgi:CheY-like chemotaxis protein
MKILIVEDSRMLRLAMERSLVKARYEVTSVGDGQQGLQLAQRMHPDLILLDMMLPTLDGTAVLRELKSDPGTKYIPVVVLSGLSEKNAARLSRAGAAAYFQKSKLNLDNDPEGLVRFVQELLSSSPGPTPTH